MNISLTSQQLEAAINQLATDLQLAEAIGDDTSKLRRKLAIYVAELNSRATA